ncbi:MAG: flagellar basal body P-ring protein FlgI [Alphaproteobacteria bacterium]
MKKSTTHPKTRNPVRRAVMALTVLATCIAWTNSAIAQSRIKDIVEIEGIRDNILIGYGLVVGLNGSGDSLSSNVFTKQSLIGMLERLGVNANDTSLDAKNVAAVMVTGQLPAFARQGAKIDVSVSALGNSSSLLGGTLLVTPMLGADGEVYAVAQGTLAVGGFAAAGAAETVVKGVPTSGRIPNGAIVERELPFQLSDLKRVRLSLRNPDFTTARRVARAINAFVGLKTAKASDNATIVLDIPSTYKGELVELLTDIEQLQVQPDQIAKVIIDEQSGIIVMGENVRISTVAIAQGNLTIRITETQQVSQPAPFSNTGTTETVNRTAVEVDEGEDRKFAVLPNGVTLQELVNGLNALGIGPRDMITILQAVKASGSMQADIEVL